MSVKMTRPGAATQELKTFTFRKIMRSFWLSIGLAILLHLAYRCKVPSLSSLSLVLPISVLIVTMDTCNSYAINSQAPNPLTPMAFISPEIARQITVSIYITVGCMSVNFMKPAKLVPL